MQFSFDEQIEMKYKRSSRLNNIKMLKDKKYTLIDNSDVENIWFFNLLILMCFVT